MHTHHGFRGAHVLFIGLHVVWIRRTMASATADAVSVRDPLNESGDIDYLISLGPVQPTGTFKTTDVLVAGNIKRLRFQNSWFQGRPWLEYSSASDSACCFYCRLFKPKVNGMHAIIISAFKILYSAFPA